MIDCNLRRWVPFLFVVCALAGGATGCGDPSSPFSAEDNMYGFYADDPSVYFKRRDVLAPPEPAPLSEVLSTFEIADGFRIELFAAEPLVTDPVDMAVDAAGRMYVLELHSYPDKENASTIKLLRDTDGDGLPDQSTVFAEGLRMPKGIMAWKGGLLVTDAPDVLFLKDTDRDGHADQKDVLLTGFVETNPQLGVNNPIYGLDNWIYLANWGSSDVSFPARSDSTHAVSGVVRARPATYDVEGLGANSQFGQTIGAWGHRFSVSNSNHLYQQVIAARYLKRNPNLLVASVTEILPDHGASATVYPITPNPNHRLGTAGGITSASGLAYYGGGLFPPSYQHVTFVGAPIYNVVHVDRLSRDGATLTASRLQEKQEFLASTDRWFRPVNFYVGPDGALYVLDYSRRVIEQPKFLTHEVLEAVNLYEGTERGRIYRIVPEGTEAPSWLGDLHLKGAPVEQLVQALERENIWWRRTAQRLLVTRRLEAAAGPLRRLVRESPVALARVHALWTLEGLGALEPALIERALRDEAAGVRENAIRLAELHLLEASESGPERPIEPAALSSSGASEAPALIETLLAMAEDPDPHVRFQLLCTLGYLGTDRAREVRQGMLFADLEDKWMQIAALSASSLRPLALYERALSEVAGDSSEAHRAFFERVSTVIGARGRAGEVRQVLRTSVTASSPSADWWRAASLEGLAEGLQGQQRAPASLSEERALLLETFFDTGAAPVREAYLDVLSAVGLPYGALRTATLEKARATAANRQADPTVRADALRLLALANPRAHADLFKRLIVPQEPAPVQKAAVQVLGRLEGEGVGSFLLSRWSKMTPEVREVAIGVLLAERKRLFQLFDAIEAGKVSPLAIPRYRAEDLVESEDDEIHERANEVLRREAGRRQEVLAAYQTSLKMEAHAGRGEAVFERVCARCHQIGSSGGRAFGPDLTALSNRPPEWLLRAILIPGKAIAEGYELWVIKRKSGDAVTGIIASETSTSLTVRSAGGQETTLARADIQSMQVAGASAMPVGLENQISKQEMADLIAYLMSLQTVN